MSGIVVGIDGSGHSERALEWATREAALRQVPLTVITVHQPVVGYLGSAVSSLEDHDLSERVRKAAREQTDRVLDRLGASAPPQVTVDAVSGSTAEELLGAAKDANADLPKGGGDITAAPSHPRQLCQVTVVAVVRRVVRRYGESSG